MSKPGLAPLILTVWLCCAVLVGLSGIFESASASLVAATVWAVTITAGIAIWVVPALRRWAIFVSVRSLLALHLARFVGVYFLVLCRRGTLSCVFARPAGIGDIIVATGAAILLGWSSSSSRVGDATAGAQRPYLLVWNTIGLLDILFVVFSALRVGLRDPAGMAPLRAFALSLLPAFLVPVIIVSHILIFLRVAGKRGVQPVAL